MSGQRTITTTFSGLALLATIVGVGIMAVGNLLVDQTSPGDLVARQQQRLVEMGRELDALVAARDPGQAEAARLNLQRTVAAFDDTQTALAWGGTATDEDGRPAKVAALADGDALRALRRVATLWRPVGAQLAELAAGAYSVHGDAGRRAAAGLHGDGPTLARDLQVAAAALADWRPATSWRSVAAGLIAAGLVLMIGGARGVSRENPGRRRAPGIGTGAGHAAGTGQTAAAPPDAGAGAGRTRLRRDPVPEPDVEAGANVTAGLRADPLAGFRSGLGGSGAAAADLDGGTVLVRSANRAANSAAVVATELGECVRDAERIRDRIARLARWTRETADVIGAEARTSGSLATDGDTSAVREATDQANRTAETAAEIEHTISILLRRTREYEESVGRILGDVSVIHRSTRRLARTPDTPAQAPPAAPRADLAAPEVPPVPAPDDSDETEVPPRFPEFPVPPQDEEPEATVDQVAAETAAAIAELVELARGSGATDDTPSDDAPAETDDAEDDERQGP